MKLKWLNLILHLTSRIYSKKQKLLISSMGKAISLALQICGMELILFIISLPTYFFIKQDLIINKGNNEKAVINYKIRKKFFASMAIIVIFILIALLIIKSFITVFFVPINAM